MNSKQILDVHQMQHLQELGLDTSNASMHWISYNGISVSIPSNFHLPTSDNDYVICDAYTLQDVLDVQDVLDALPIEIKYKDKRCWLCIELADEMIGYYYENARFEHRWVYYEVVMIDESLIDAAYSLLCWAIDNKFVETNKNE